MVYICIWFLTSLYIINESGKKKETNSKKTEHFWIVDDKESIKKTKEVIMNEWMKEWEKKEKATKLCMNWSWVFIIMLIYTVWCIPANIQPNNHKKRIKSHEEKTKHPNLYMINYIALVFNPIQSLMFLFLFLLLSL